MWQNYFITMEVDLSNSPMQVQRAIEQELQKRSQHFSWVVTDVDVLRQKALVDAWIVKPY